MDGVAHPHLEMLANQVAHARERLRNCQPRERFECGKSLEQALEHLKDYVAMPDPDREKELRQIKKAMKAAALAAHGDGVAYLLFQRANAL